MNDLEAKKTTSVLGLISIVIAVMIAVCFVILAAVAYFRKAEEPLLLWAFPTFITAPLGIAIGGVALYTKRAWVGLALNLALLLLDVMVMAGILLQGVTAFR